LSRKTAVCFRFKNQCVCQNERGKNKDERQSIAPRVDNVPQSNVLQTVRHRSTPRWKERRQNMQWISFCRAAYFHPRDSTTGEEEVMETATRLWEMSEKIESLSDEIERLRAREAKLREALQWYVDNDDTNEGDEPDEHGETWNEINRFWLEGRDRARAALGEEKK
jgi:regulator of replication initiation timing